MTECSRIGVDLVGADDAGVVGVLDRRVHLEQVPVAEIVALERVLALASGADERRDRLVRVDRLFELVIEPEVLVDLAAIAVRHQAPAARAGKRVRPGEDAVCLPDLHRDDVRLPEDALGKLGVLAPGDVDAVAANERRLHDPADVAGEGRLLGGECLGVQRAGEDRAERNSCAGADERRGEQKDAQERERPLEVASTPQPHQTLVHSPHIGAVAP